MSKPKILLLSAYHAQSHHYWAEQLLSLQAFDWLPGWVISFGLPILPYLIPIVVLALISADATMIRRNAPASLGRSFAPSR